MVKRGAEMGKEGEEEQISEIGVQRTQRCIKLDVEWQDWCRFQ